MDLSIFLVLAPFGLAVQVFVLTRTWPHRHAADGRLLLGLVVAGIGWLFFNTLEVLAWSIPAKVALAQLTYVFIGAIPVLLFALSLRLVDLWQWLTPLRSALLFALYPITVMIVLTGTHHELFWRDPQFVAAGDFSRILVTNGPWFYVHSAYAFALIGAASVLMILAYPRVHRVFRQQTLWIVMGASLPLLLSLLYVFDLWPWQKDFSPIAYSFSMWACARGMGRYRLFDLRPIARDAMVDGMREGMLVLNEKNEIVDINPAARAIVGATTGPIVGRSICEFLPPHGGCVHPHDVSQIGPEIEMQSEGIERTYDLSISPLSDRQGRHSGRLVLLQDITERRKSERALREANEELELRNRELDAFAGTVAHDLRNPLHALMGYGQILSEEWETLSNDVRAECVGTILDCGRRMSRIIEALLLLARVRKESVALVPLDMSQIVDEVQRNLSPMISAARAEITAPAHWPSAAGYAPWVEAVWANYLSNALKYGGRHPRIELGALQQDDQSVRFWVRDRGPGLSDDQRARLFVPFERLDASVGEGHGLGLSIVQRLVEKQQGTCGVESTGLAGEGCTFFFTLRAVAPAMTATEPMSPSVASEPTA
jgi:PAS domain S-box-containing protein